jgi:hypothetical protein
MASSPYYRSAHWRALRQACIGRDRGRCVVPGCSQPGKVVDHIKTRPRLPYPTEFDVLDNVRLICLHHDLQCKELHTGERRAGGDFKVKGASVDGWPLDPRWNK